MQCDRARPLLEDFVDGDIGREDAARLSDHLASCGGCQERLDRIRAAEAIFRGSAPPSPDPTLAQRIARSVEDGRAHADSGGAGVAAGLGLLAAAAALWIVLGPPDWKEGLSTAWLDGIRSLGSVPRELLSSGTIDLAASSGRQIASRIGGIGIVTRGGVLLLSLLVAAQILGNLLLLVPRRPRREEAR